jgi:hypothetical protein
VILSYVQDIPPFITEHFYSSWKYSRKQMRNTSSLVITSIYSHIEYRNFDRQHLSIKEMI